MKNTKRTDFLLAIYDFAKMAENLGKTSKLSKSEMSILTTIELLKNNYKEEVTTARISEILCLSKSAISQMLKSMEESGYIVRKVCKSDRRVTLVDYTQKGKKAYEEQVDNFINHSEKVFEKMQMKDVEKFIASMKQYTVISNEILKEKNN